MNEFHTVWYVGGLTTGAWKACCTCHWQTPWIATLKEAEIHGRAHVKVWDCRA